MIDVMQHYAHLQKDSIMLSYCGRLSEDLIHSLLQLAETKFYDLQTAPMIRKKVINILIESLQNVFHHGQNILQVGDYEQSLIMICHHERGYLVATGNYLDTQSADQMCSRLDEINSMSKDELSASYRSSLAYNPRRAAGDISGGAGVGIIDIARRSGQKIVYDLHRCSDQVCFLSIQIKID